MMSLFCGVLFGDFVGVVCCVCLVCGFACCLFV